MKKYGVNELRKMFLDFMESKGHLVMKSFSLVPQGDKSLLLINAGMAPLPGDWGPGWGNWYYPYPVVYSYSVGSLLTELVDLDTPAASKADAKLPVLWTAYMSGLLSGSDKFDTQLAVRAIEQAFVQSPYVKK